MTCNRCDQPALYRVRRNQRDPGEQVCDTCLPAARQAAGVPRQTELLDPMSLPAARAAGTGATQGALF